jgi:predicted permease
LRGFVDVFAIVAVGYVASRTRSLTPDTADALLRITFRLALPALVFTSVARAPLQRTLSMSLLVSSGVTITVFACFALAAKWRYRHSNERAVIGAWSATYSNAGYLGVPMAAYVFHDITSAVSVVLFQLTILMPIGVAILESASTRGGFLVVFRRSVTGSPVVVAAVAGLLIAASRWSVPDVVMDPVIRISEIAVPAVLLAFGATFTRREGPNTDVSMAALVAVCLTKVVIIPGLVFIVARYAAGLDTSTCLQSTLIAAMPTAVNVYAVASTYRQCPSLAHASSVATTVLSLPVIAVLAIGWT